MNKSGTSNRVSLLGYVRRKTQGAWWLHSFLIFVLGLAPMTPVKLAADPPEGSYSFSAVTSSPVSIYENQSTTLTTRLMYDDGSGNQYPITSAWVDWYDGNGTSLGGGYTDGNGEATYTFQSDGTLGTYYLQARETYTGQNQQADFQVSVNGQYVLNNVSGGGTISSGSTTTLTAQLWDNYSSSAVSSSYVEWRDSGGNVLYSSWTDGSGYATYEFSGGVGSHTVTAIATGNSATNPAATNFGITVEQGSSHTFTPISGGGGIYEGQSTTLTARLMHDDGYGNQNAVSGALVEWFDGNGTSLGAVYTDSYGDATYTFQSTSVLGNYDFVAREAYTGNSYEAPFGVTVSAQYTMHQYSGGGSLGVGNTVTLTAQLWDNLNNAPAAYASVEWRDVNGAVVSGASTDENGYTTYDFYGESPGEYSFTVIAPGHTYDNPASTNFYLTVEPSPYFSLYAVSGTPTSIYEGSYTTLTARLVENDGYGNESAIGGATVEWFDGNGTSLGSGTTDSYGEVSYEFTATPVGTYTVTARESYTGQNLEAPFEISVQNLYTMNAVSGGGGLAYGESMTLTAQLWDNQNGGPVANAWTQWYDENSSLLYEGYTDSNGEVTYSYYGGNSGDHTVNVIAPGHTADNPAGTSFSISVSSGSTYLFTAQSGGGGIYEGQSTTLVARLVSDDGNGNQYAVEGASVEWIDSSGGSLGWVTTDGNGEAFYTFQSSSELGDFDFTAREYHSGSYMEAYFGVSVSPRYSMTQVSGGGSMTSGDTMGLTVRLWDNIDQVGVSGASVEWNDTYNGWLNSTSTDGDGYTTYDYYASSSGDIEVTASAPGYTSDNPAWTTFNLSVNSGPYYSLSTISQNPVQIYETQMAPLVVRFVHNDGYGNETAVTNALVEWYDAEGNVVYSGYTDNNGEVAYEFVSDGTLGTYNFTVREAHTGENHETSFEVYVAAQYSLNIVSGGGSLSTGSYMTLTAQLWDNLAGSHVSYATVDWYDENGYYVASGSTDDSGYVSYEFYGEYEGNFVRTAIAPGHTMANPATAQFDLSVQVGPSYSFSAYSGGGGIYEWDTTTLVARLVTDDGYGNQYGVEGASVDWYDGNGNHLTTSWTDSNGDASYEFQASNILGTFDFLARENHTGENLEANFGVSVSNQYSLLQEGGGGAVGSGSTTTLTVRLWDNINEVGVGDAAVYWYDENGTQIGNGTTDMDGYTSHDYYVDGTGHRTVTATAPDNTNANPASTTFDIYADDTSGYSLSTVSDYPVSIHEGEGTTLVARLMYNDGTGNYSAVPGAQLEWFDDQWNSLGTSTTDSNGDATYTYQSEYVGTYTFTARELQSGNNHETGFEVHVSSLYTMNSVNGGGSLSVGNSMTLTAQLWDNPGSTQVSGANVDWYDQNGNLLYSGTTDGAGETTYEFYGDSTGEFTVTVVAPGHTSMNPASTSFTILVEQGPTYSFSAHEGGGGIYEGDGTTLVARLLYYDSNGSESAVGGALVEWYDGNGSYLGYSYTDGYGDATYTFQSGSQLGEFNFVARETHTGNNYEAPFGVTVSPQFVIQDMSGGISVEPGEVATVSGRLWDNIGEQGVGYVSVEVYDENGGWLSSGSTDEYGYISYEYYTQSEGEFAVTFIAPDYTNDNPASRTFPISVYSNDYYSFQRTSEYPAYIHESTSATLTGRLVYNDGEGNETAISDAMVEWFDGNGNLISTTTTDSHGDTSYVYENDGTLGTFYFSATETYSGHNAGANYEVQVAQQFTLNNISGGGTSSSAGSMTLTVQLWDNAAGSYVPSATVYWYDENGSVIGESSTDGEGYASYDFQAPVGDYVVTATTPGHSAINPATTNFNITVEPGSYYEMLRVSDSPAYTFEGQPTTMTARLIYDDGYGNQSSIGGAQVDWYDENGTHLGGGTTDNNGEVSYTWNGSNEVRTHTFTARESYSGDNREANFEIAVQQQYTLNAVAGGGSLVYQDSMALTAQLWDNLNSGPVGYATVDWYDNATGNLLYSGTTDQDGYVSYEFYGSDLGAHMVNVTAPLHTEFNPAGTSFSIDVVPGSSYSFLAYSGGGGIYEGQSTELVARLLLDDGNGNSTGIEGASVDWYDGNGYLVASTTTNSDGDAFYLFEPGIQLGDYNFVARESYTGESREASFGVSVSARYTMQQIFGGGSMGYGSTMQLSARLWDNVEGIGVGGAAVEWYESIYGTYTYATTDGDGYVNYEFEGDSIGQHNVSVRAPDHSYDHSAYTSFEIYINPVTNYSLISISDSPAYIYETQSTTLVARLLQDDGHGNQYGVGGALVEWYDQSSNHLGSSWTDWSGYASFEFSPGTVLGTHTITAREAHSGYNHEVGFLVEVSSQYSMNHINSGGLLPVGSTMTVTGQLWDNIYNHPVTYAYVYWYDENNNLVSTTMTDGNGYTNYEYYADSEGWDSVWVQAPDYSSANPASNNFSFLVVPGPTYSFSSVGGGGIIYEGDSSTLVARLVYNDGMGNEDPVENASVEWYDSGWNYLGYSYTDNNGDARYTWQSGSDLGMHTILAREAHTGNNMQTSFGVSVAQRYGMHSAGGGGTLALGGTMTLTARLWDNSSGNPVSNATVEWRDDYGNVIGSSNTDEWGYATHGYYGANVGNHGVTAQAPGYTTANPASTSFGVTVASYSFQSISSGSPIYEDQTSTLVARLTRMDEYNSVYPVGYATVEWLDGNGNILTSTSTDGDGYTSYNFSASPSGTYYITAREAYTGLNIGTGFEVIVNPQYSLSIVSGGGVVTLGTTQTLTALLWDNMNSTIVTGAYGEWRDQNGNPLVTGPNDGGGYFTYEFSADVLGNHEITLITPGHSVANPARAIFNITVGTGPTHYFNAMSGSGWIYENQSSTLAARLVHSDGAGSQTPVEGAGVEWFDENGYPLSTTTTDSGGYAYYTYNAGTQLGYFNFVARESYTGNAMEASFSVGVAGQYSMNAISGGGTLLSGQTMTLTARLWDNINSVAVGNVSVEWRDQNGYSLGTGTTDGDGYVSYGYTAGSTGMYSVTANAPGYSSANPAYTTFGLQVAAYYATPISGDPSTIYEGQSVPLTARFSYDDGTGNITPVNYASVDWLDGNGNMLGNVSTDWDGYTTFSFSSTVVGTHTIRARENVTGYGYEASFQVTVLPQHSMNYISGGGNVTAGNTTTLTAQLVDNLYGGSVHYAPVEWRDQSGNVVYTTTTDSGGYTSYDFNSGSTGSYSMSVVAPGHTSANPAAHTFSINVVTGPSTSFTYVSGNGSFYEGQSTTMVARLAQDDGMGNLSGISGASVGWYDGSGNYLGSGTTDNNGEVSYGFQTTQLGTHSFTARESYTGYSIEVPFSVSISPQYSFQHVSGGGSMVSGTTMTLTARLWDNLNSSYVPYASVYWHDENGYTIGYASTDENGYVSYGYGGGSTGSHTITAVASGHSSANPATIGYGVWVSNYSFSPVSGSGTIYEGQSTTLTARLTQTDEYGNSSPVSNAWVEWYDGSGASIGTAYTDWDGYVSASYSATTVGSHTIRARETSTGAYLEAHFTVTVAGQYSINHVNGGGTISVGGGMTLTGQLWDNFSSNYVSSAYVEWRDGSGNLLHSGYTDGSGYASYDFFGTSSGSFSVTATATGHTNANPASRTFNINVNPAPTPEFFSVSGGGTVYEDQSSTLVARLVMNDNGSHSPISGAWVNWYDGNNSQIGGGYTDSSGEVTYTFQAGTTLGTYNFYARETHTGQNLEAGFGVTVSPRYGMTPTSGGGGMVSGSAMNLTVRLYDYVASSGVSGATIEWRDENGSFLGTSPTDGDGYASYTYHGGSAGNRTVSATAPGYSSAHPAGTSFSIQVTTYSFSPVSGSGTIYEGQSTTLTARLTYDNEGNGNQYPVSSTWVEWFDSNNSSIGGAYTDWDGYVSQSFSSSTVGTYTLRARETGTGLSLEANFQVEVSPQFSMNQVSGGGNLEEGNSMTLTAQLYDNINSSPVGSANVVVTDANGNTLDNTWTDYSGFVSYEYGGATVGTHPVTFTAPNNSGNNPASTTFTIIVTPGTPAAPSGLTITGASATTAGLAWTDNSSNETGFAIERSLNGGVSWTLAASPAADATSYTVTGLSGSSAYEFRVRAVNGAQASDPSNTVSLPALPAAAGNVGAEATEWDTAAITWELPVDVTRTAVVLRSYEEGASVPRLVETLAAGATNYTDTPLSELTDYTYVIATVNMRGETALAPVGITTPLKPLPAPSDLDLTTSTPTSASLAWVDNSSIESGFRVLRSGDNVTFTQVAQLAAGTTSYVDSTLQENSQYFYKVVAYRTISGEPDQTSDPSNVIQMQSQFTQPSAPTSLAASNVTAQSATLTWLAGGANQVSYDIQVSTNGSGGPWQTVSSVASTVLTKNIEGLDEKTNYLIRVVAVNPAGTAASGTVPVLTLAAVPATPTGLAVTAATGTTATLAWLDHASNETGYLVESSSNAGTNWSTVATVAANVTSYDVTGLTGSTAYQFRVKAVNAGVFSAASDVASLVALPSLPTGVTPVATAWNRVQLSWTLPTDASRTGVRVTGYVTGSGTPRIVVNLPATATSFSDSGLQASTGYQYVVATVNARGVNSAATASTTTPSQAPLAATGVTPVANGPRKVTVTWTDNAADETKYVVQRSTNISFTSIVSSPDLPAGTTSYVDTTGLQGNIQYFYRVSVTNPFSTVLSTHQTVTTPNYPAANRAPDALAVQPRGNQAFTADTRIDGVAIGVQDDADPIGNYWVFPATTGDGRNVAGVFQFTGVEWQALAVVQPASETWDAAQEFGAKISVSGNRIFVSAPSARREAGNSSSPRTGAVFVFDWNGTNTATQVQRIVPTASGAAAGAAGDYFGGSLAVDGDRLIVGAPFRDVTVSSTTYTDAGQVYLYDRTTSWVFNRAATSTAPSAEGWFGYSVGLRGRHFVAGAPKEDQFVLAGSGNLYILDDTGAVYFGVWDRPTEGLSGVDNPTAYYLDENNFAGVSYSYFGADVDISSDLRVAIGAPYHSWTTWNSNMAPFIGGSVYYLNWNGQLGSQFDSPISLLNINNLHSGDGFGSRIELNAATREFWVASSAYLGDVDGSSWLVVSAANGSPGNRVTELNGHDPDTDPMTYTVVNGSPGVGVTYDEYPVLTGGTDYFEVQTDVSGAKWLAIKNGTNPQSGRVYSVGVKVDDDRSGTRTFYTNVIIDGAVEFTDADLDGIDDAWELSHGLSPANGADALLDVDGDGLTALEEFQRSRSGQGSGTNPNQWDLEANGDDDGDGVVNKEDADPFNPNVLRLNITITQPGPGSTI